MDGKTKALPKPDLIVALGDARYLIERPFGSWPQNAGFVTDVTVDARGHVFVMLRHDPLTQPDDPRVVELSPEGEYLGGWGGDLTNINESQENQNNEADKMERGEKKPLLPLSTSADDASQQKHSYGYGDGPVPIIKVRDVDAGLGGGVQ